MAAGTGIILAIVLLCALYFILEIWDSYKLRKLRKKYDNNNGKREKGEPPGRVRGITAAEPPTAGATVAYQRELLQATEAIPTGEADVGNGKDTNFVGKFFQKFRREWNQKRISGLTYLLLV